jgi:hypothetical protein
MTDYTITARASRDGHHTYRLNGIKLPGPSSIAGLAPSGGLVVWAAQAAADYTITNWDSLSKLGLLERGNAIKGAPTVARDKAAADGKLRHKVMEQLAAGQAVETTDPSVLADAEAVVRLMNEWGIEPLHTEIGLVHPELLYGGTADLVATSERLGGVFLVDYKFGKGIYANHALQFSGYSHATHRVVETEQFGPRGGKLKSTWSLEPAPEMSQTTAYAIHAHDGVAELIPVKIDGWVWDAAQVFLDVYWAWEVRTGYWFKDADTYDDPIGQPLIQPIKTRKTTKKKGTV